jgi:DNA-binding transcriptional ArsR family regulator
MGRDAVYKALSDPTRREILHLLRDGEKTAGQLTDRFPISGPSMSHHFSLLKQADLIAARRDGQQIYYSLNTTAVQDLIVALFDLIPAEAKTEKQVDQVATDSGKKK